MWQAVNGLDKRDIFAVDGDMVDVRDVVIAIVGRASIVVRVDQVESEVAGKFEDPIGSVVLLGLDVLAKMRRRLAH